MGNMTASAPRMSRGWVDMVRAATVLAGASASVAVAQAIPPTPTIRDSAGIQIVSSPAALATRVLFRLSETPTLDIGGLSADPHRELVSAGSAVRLSNGNVAIAQYSGRAGVAEVRIYNTQGRYVRSIGRPGQGPGEFGALQQVMRLQGETLVAQDERRQFSYFDTVGAFVRRETLAAEPVGLFEDGSVLVTRSYGTPGKPVPPYGWLDSIRLMRMRGATVVDSGRPFPNSATTVMDGVIVPAFFGPRTVTVVDRDHFLLAHGVNAVIGDYAPNGRQRRSIRVDLAPRRVTDADIDHYLEAEMNGRTAEQIVAARQTIARMGRPSEFPAFSRLVVDTSSRIWACEYQRPGDAITRWLVFDPDGRLLGNVSVPRGIGVLEVGANDILVSVLDSDDSPHVRVYRLLPPQS